MQLLCLGDVFKQTLLNTFSHVNGMYFLTVYMAILAIIYKDPGQNLVTVLFRILIMYTTVDMNIRIYRLDVNL